MSAASGEPAPGAVSIGTGDGSAGSGVEGFAETGLDWDKVMHLGLGVLRLAPRDFWAMTPRELAAALGAFMPRHAQAPDRADLRALMQRFPDRAALLPSR